MRIHVRSLVILAMLASLVSVLARPAESSAGGVLLTSGRISFYDPEEYLNTRNGGGARLAAGVDFPLLSSSILSIEISGSTSRGTAQVHPCGQPLLNEWDFVFAVGQPLIRQVSTEQVPMCFQSTAAIHVKILAMGQVLRTPVLGGFQYVPYDAEQIISESVSAPLNGSGTSFELTPFNQTGQGVYYIEAVGSGRFYGELQRCSAPAGPPTLTAFIADNATTATVAYRYLETFDYTCLRLWGTGTVTVTQLGEMSQFDPSTAYLLAPEALSGVDYLYASGFQPSEPTRVLDTRRSIGSPPGVVAANQVLPVDLSSVVTKGTTSVVLNVTATGSQAPGFVTVFPCGQPTPNASNLNFAAGQDVANLVTVRLGTNRSVCMVSTATTHLIADFAGRFVPGGGSLGTPVAPTRILDTRTGNGAPTGEAAKNSVIALQVAGRGSVPTTGANAVTMNVTVTGADEGGFITAYPCDRPQPDASNINFIAGKDVPNLVTVKLSATGTVCIATTGTTHLLADVAMWFGQGGTSGFVDVAPTRVLDSRLPVPTGVTGSPRRIEPNERLVRVPLATVTTNGDVIEAVVMNVTVTGPTGDGFLTLYPCNVAKPDASNLNFASGADVANLTTVKVSPTNEVCFTPSAASYILGDVAGYFTSTSIQVEKIFPLFSLQ
jgi:hypothetical protein